MAAVLPPLSEPAKSQFFLPIATALSARSAALLSISILPLSRNLLNAVSLLRAYLIALEVELLFGNCLYALLSRKRQISCILQKENNMI